MLLKHLKGKLGRDCCVFASPFASNCYYNNCPLTTIFVKCFHGKGIGKNYRHLLLQSEVFLLMDTGLSSITKRL